MCNQIFKSLRKACCLGMLGVFLAASWQTASADICFVLDQDCINMGSVVSSSTKGCTGYNADKNYGLTNETVTCESCTNSDGTTIKHKFKCKCKNDKAKCVDSKCSDCKYTTDDTCKPSEYKYSSDKGTGWDCDPCIDKLSKQWGKYKCKCDDTIGYWMVNNNCSKDPCYSIFESPASSRVSLSQADNLEKLEYTCDKCPANEQSQFAGKASCVCNGVIDSRRNNRCVPQGRCDADGYYYTLASCEAVWGLSGICREITSGQYKYCIQGEDDSEDVCPSPWKTKKSDCTTPFIAEHPTVKTPHSGQPCYDCREKECKLYDGFNYFREDCMEEQEEVNVPISASNVASISGGKLLKTIDLECSCFAEGPGSGTEKSLNGQMYTYYDLSPCCKWLAKVDADTKQILDDIESLKDKSPNCGMNSDKCWYNTFTSRGCTKRYEDEMKSKEYKWTDADKKSKEYARTHFCYYPDKDKCDIMNKCDLYKCDTAYFKIQVHSFACVADPKFNNNTTLSDKLKIGQSAQINSNSTLSCGPGIGHGYPHETLKGWVIGETPPDISTADGMYNYMKSYKPKKSQESSSITITAQLLRDNNAQTTGDCAGNIDYGILNVFPYVEIKCPIDTFDTGTNSSKCSSDSPQHSSGWKMVAAPGVFSKACVQCQKKNDCSTGYSTTVTDYGTENKYYGDQQCYRICHTDYDYDKVVSSCGSRGASGWLLENWSSNSHCKKCKAKTCPTGYSTSYTSYGTSSTYAGQSTCYRICKTGYDYDKELSSCGNGSWELEEWSSNDHCKKCKAKPCPTDEYTYSVCQNKKGTKDSCVATSNYSGSDRCYKIEVCNSSSPKWCPVHENCHNNCCTDGTIKPCDTRCGGCGCTKKTNIAFGESCCPDAGDTCAASKGDKWCDGTAITRTCSLLNGSYKCIECVTDSDCKDSNRKCNANGECMAQSSCPTTPSCSSGQYFENNPGNGYTCTSATGGSGYCCHH